jgi:prepilin-type N-terminal cleavage/methylation domain-containing protein
MVGHLRQQPPVVRHRAFTLVELLVVLAVTAVLAALSWPAVRGLLERTHLQSAAKQLRAVLVRARLDAMDSGTVRQFRYQPGTGCYEVSVAASLDGGDEAGLDNDGGPALGPREVVTDTLPGGAIFEAAPAGEDLLGEGDLPEADAEGPWSAPVWFYPNGRTSSARFRLAGQRDCAIEVSLRAVTGSVVIGQLQHAEAAP